jgi:membrane-bound lytic murein transglycosylase D
MLIGDGFIQNDLKILKELDLPSAYITDYEFQKFYSKFSKKYKKTYTNKLQKAELFIPIIKKILKENDMPSAFLYLAMAESNFILQSKSHKKAVGIWQFMPKTAKANGLDINHYIDERMDIEKSTLAAVKYLKKLHKMFGKWYIASIAYNCGEARVIEAITRATLDKYCIDNDNCKKDRTIKHYRKTIKDYQSKKIKFSKINRIYKKIQKWNYKIGIDDLLIVQKNSKYTKLRRQYIPNESRKYIKKIVSLAIMNNSEYLLSDKNNHLLNMGISSPIAKVEVKGGILLKKIADIIGISSLEIKRLNPHIKKNITPLEYDKKYSIFIPYSTLSRFNYNKDNIKGNDGKKYVVKKGDSLSKIAKNFGVNYSFIKKYNHLKSTILKIGQSLIIPIDPYIYKRPKYYFAKKGDTLSEISKKFKVPLKRVLKDNPNEVSSLNKGDKIVINFK